MNPRVRLASLLGLLLVASALILLVTPFSVQPRSDYQVSCGSLVVQEHADFGDTFCPRDRERRLTTILLLGVNGVLLAGIGRLLLRDEPVVTTSRPGNDVSKAPRTTQKR